MAFELDEVLYCTVEDLKDETFGYPLCVAWGVHHLIIKTTKFLGPDLELAITYINELNGRYVSPGEVATLIDYISGGSTGEYMQ